jgi:hypothetical protein
MRDLNEQEYNGLFFVAVFIVICLILAGLS